MGNEIVTFALMGSYAFVMLAVWAVFEKRLNVIYRRHVEKCAPFGERGLEKVDRKLRFVVRSAFGILIGLSLGIIYLMTS